MAGISSGIEIRSAWFSKKNGSRYKYALRDLTQLEYFGVPGDTEKSLWNAWFFPAADAATEAATETIAVSITESAVVVQLTPIQASDSLTVRLNGSTGGSGTAQVSVSDTLRSGLTDTFTGSQALTVPDSLTVSISDTSLISSTCSATDSIRSGLNDGTASIVAVLSASDSLSVQATDALRPVSVSVSIADTLLSGLLDAFTGSQAFTVTDTLACSLTEAASCLSSVTASDLGAIQASESVTQLSAVLTSSDSAACIAIESAPLITIVVIGSDSLRVNLGDVFTGSQALSVSDLLSTGLTESAVCLSTLSVADSVAIQFSESVTQLAAVLTASDSCKVQGSDSITSTLLVVTTSDSIAAGLTDVFTGSQALSTQDTLSVQFSEAISTAVSAVASDALTLNLDDLGALSQVTISASESISVGLSGVANVLQNTLLSVSDNLVTGLTESATLTQAFLASDSLGVILGDAFTGSQALGVSDDTGLQLSEDQSSSLLAAASDGVATSLSEAVSAYFSRFLTDTISIQLADVGSKQDIEQAIPKTAIDSCGVSVEEGAVTELAGPYWSGTTGEDRGLVYADSYMMGRRENPGRMRW